MKVQNKGDKGNPWHSDKNGKFTRPQDNIKDVDNDQTLSSLKQFVKEDLSSLDKNISAYVKTGFNKLIDNYPADIGEVKYELSVGEGFYNVPYTTLALNRIDTYQPDPNNMGKFLGPRFLLSLGTQFYYDAEYSAKELLTKNNSPLGRGYRKISSQEAIEAILSHEYAHSLSYMYALKKQPELLQFIKKWQSESMTYEEMENNEYVKQFEAFVSSNYMLEKEIVSELSQEYNIPTDMFWQQVRQEYGKYAATSYLEFFAEAFMCMNHLQNNEKTDFMRSFERIFSKKYKDTFGG